MSNGMKWAMLIFAILAVSIVFQWSRRAGAGLLIIIVLGMVYQAQKRGLIP